MAKIKIKKGDKVVVLAGSSRGKQGIVLQIDTTKNKALVQGVNMVKKHKKPSAENPQGQILEQEAFIHISNIALIDPSKGIATRVGTTVEYKEVDGKKKRITTRIAKKSGKPV